MVNAGIQSDPNLIKLLKTREVTNTEEEESKIKMNALNFSRKLNQMSESLSLLLGNIKKLEGKIKMVESDLSSQIN